MEIPTRMLVLENFGTCNLRCTYCFPEHMWQRQGHRGVVDASTFCRAVEHVLSTTSASAVDLHLAGGEPLLAGRSWLAWAFATARAIAARYDKTITFSLQTNATTVTPELAAFLVAEHVSVGVSLDGDRVLNETTRGGTDRTLAGFGHLRDAAGGRAPGVIVTVTRCNAERMDEVIAYLDGLDVAMFRANQMGATASWNEHAAPRADEWAGARATILQEIAGRRGRVMEFNLSESVPKYVTALLGGASPMTDRPGCGAMRCTAGRELLYVDRTGSTYPCPRSTVTAEARIGHVADVDIIDRREAAALALDAAMEPPAPCRSCPAQVACDYGCHAFNVARGNFFEVNCDASKAHAEFLAEHPEDVARVALLVAWRNRMRAAGDYAAVRAGTDLPGDQVAEVADRLRRAWDRHLERTDLDPDVLRSRHGWRPKEVPMLTLDRPRRRAAAPTR